MNEEERIIAYQNGMTLSEEQQLYWDKEDYLEIDKDKEIERLNNIINELEKDIENQIIFCTNEANGTINDKYCRIAINYLKHLKGKLQELKGSENE